MAKKQKKILIIIGFIILLIALSVVVLSMILGDEEKSEKTPNNTNNKVNISKNIVLLQDDNVFFRLQNTINNYYNLLSNKNTNILLNVLDKDYVKANNINSNNIYTKIYSNYESVNFVASKIYYNPSSTITYYFINGYLINESMMEDKSEYNKSVNYLVVVDSRGNFYDITPLDNTLDIYNITKSYKIEEKKITSNEILSTYNMSEKNKLIVYISNFLNLLVYDTERAYNMLSNDTKNKYSSYEEFNSMFIDIYNSISTLIFSYNKKEINNETIYNIIMDNQKKIYIYEKNTMDYKIAY